MTTAQYIRIHANASPSKLRNIIKNQIFLHDDVVYLKRLVKDVGGMDYVFRFLWYDGPVPTEDSGRWSAAVESCSGGEKQSQSNSNVPKSVGDNTSSNVGSSTKEATFGRTWIQYCCYHNAHQCLQWIFQEIVRNHLRKQQQYEKQQQEQRLAEVLSTTMGSSDRHTDISGMNNDTGCREDGTEDDTGDHRNLVKIIKHLLEFPSVSYCGTHYFAVATLRNSYQCLSLLIEYGGLDPNMPINNYGSTAAHIATWKDHVECLRVLQSGTYACRFHDSDEYNEELSTENTTTHESDGHGKEQELSHREAFSSILTASFEKQKMWSADWNKLNAMGETPMHVAAREGRAKCMQFFVDLAITSATSALTEEEMEDESFGTIDFSIRSSDGMDCAAVAAKHDHACVITLLSEAIERLLDLSIDVPDDLASPSMSRDFWHNPLSYFSPQHTHGPSLAKKAPPPSPTRANRRRTKSEPVNVSSNKISSPVGKLLPQSPRSQNDHHQQCLPTEFPTLNLRNSLEKHNHEMPIHVAARHGNCNAIEALFKSDNCDTTARDSLGQTALHVAALEGNLDACQLFVHLASDQFENFDVVDIHGRTPLYIACSMGNSSLARILVSASNSRVICHERQKSPDGPLYVDVAHQPPLHAAVVSDHVNTVSELLDCGVDVNQGDVDGRTAISAAAKLGFLEMCQMLIMHGANVNTRSTRGGPTPYQKAKKYKMFDVADLLYEFGGR
eukprot:CAMPEP_0172302352 /NCGR_PEP_ID=MMETSP1058-20130122/4059_1 /TAXON_ID=83371 /ORGANISM="Detonula confervacea, Strain CCMP 353" /LENGTH=728 /DNA_ID=CAMNT_0013012787 /DNA_START=267 /DNA_END=2453 /DNA_ORIENTATION=-